MKYTLTSNEISGLTLLAKVQDLDKKSIKEIRNELGEYALEIANAVMELPTKSRKAKEAAKKLKLFASRELPRPAIFARIKE